MKFYFFDVFKSKKICNEGMVEEPWVLHDISNHFKQEMSIETV